MSSGGAVRISELSRASGISVATVKFYLREGLLHEGMRTSATQAQYDETHLARLRLIRALLGPGGLPIARALDVLQAIDHPPESMHDLLGVAAGAVSRASPPQAHGRVHELMRRWGWRVDDKDCSTHDALQEALDALDAAEFGLPEETIDLYVNHLSQIAGEELAGVPTDSPAAAVRYVVLGTVLIEPLMLALRRMAQQEASARRFDTPAPDAASDSSSTLEP
jgi:DNA-binding transcriptional MerR regulator